MKWVGLLLMSGAFMMACMGGAMAEKVDIYARHGFWPKRPEVKRVSPDEFMIMPWGWSPGDDRALSEIKECGFNLAGFVTPEYVKQVEKAGLKCLVDDPRITGAVDQSELSDAEITRRVEESTAPFRGNPAVFGYYVKDEPHSGQFATLARWRQALAKADPKANIYINLLPIGAQDGGVKSYEEYVENFVSTVKPAFLSYDHYTIADDGTMRPSFFSNLEYIRKVSQEHGIPFWNIILANSHFRYGKPSSATLGVQAFSTMAYGGRGICYFTYFAPLVGNYRDAAIDQFLNKTPTWDMIRSINLQIHQLAPTYLKLKSVNVFHTADVPSGCHGADTSRLLSEVSGGTLLVGEFLDPDGAPYVMVVNRDLNTSTPFHVKFKKEGQIMMTSAYTGRTEPWAGENGWLAPGQGMLLSVK